MKVAVGSQNLTKVNAVKKAFEKVFPNTLWEVIGVDVPSGVANQPMTDRESIRGATNRAKRSLKKCNADFGVGIEGGMQKVGKEWFTSGWVVIINKEGIIGTGSSIRMTIPPKLLTLILDGVELGHANDLVFKQTNSKHGDGHFGLMTNNVITRTSAYQDAVFTALSRFLHPEVFR
ncbi:MAG: DUF84 family protein [Candidatus Levybacteria bacterium]|nr:DUF84 family protein [Candidatus Levybacteria bacterium]